MPMRKITPILAEIAEMVEQRTGIKIFDRVILIVDALVENMLIR